MALAVVFRLMPVLPLAANAVLPPFGTGGKTLIALSAAQMEKD